MSRLCLIKDDDKDNLQSTIATITETTTTLKSMSANHAKNCCNPPTRACAKDCCNLPSGACQPAMPRIVATHHQEHVSQPCQGLLQPTLKSMSASHAKDCCNPPSRACQPTIQPCQGLLQHYSTPIASNTQIDGK